MGIIKDDFLKEEKAKAEAKQKSKYEEALSKYNTDIDDKAVQEAVRKIITEKVHQNDTMEVKKFLMGSIELTTLKTTDCDTSVMAFTDRVNAFDEQYPDLPHVATICVYPCFASIVADTLEVEGVEIACVSGSFPSSQALIEVKVAETALAIKDGATEIDIVMPVGKFLCGDYEGCCEEISELKATCGDKAMKVILETGDLVTASNIKKASILSMYAGADYIKTSTGKEKISATPRLLMSCVKPSKNIMMRPAYRSVSSPLAALTASWTPSPTTPSSRRFLASNGSPTSGSVSAPAVWLTSC